MKYMVLILCLMFCKTAMCYDDPRVALAASCVGEAGWTSYENGECAAILFVYLKLSKQSGRTLLDIATKYSAAIKPRPNHPHKWKLNLNKEAIKPKHWPTDMKWGKYKGFWIAMLDFVHDFMSGHIMDPLPCANHYGGKMDKPNVRLKRMETPTEYSNYFYKVKGRKCKDG